VLNALRHQRFRHRRTSRPARRRNVLNALRHQRFRHAPYAFCPLIQLCAQRLTASKVSARYPINPENPGLQCSTPYGIKGFGTWCATEQTELGTSAQRLTASKVSALIDMIDGIANPSAQRLTASKVSARHTLDLRLGKAPKATLQAGNDRTTIPHQTKPKITESAIQNDLSSTILAPCKHNCSPLNPAKATNQSLSASESQSFHFTDSSPCTFIGS
jgi:hypothetical protein